MLSIQGDTSRILRSYVFGPSGFWTMAPLRYVDHVVLEQSLGLHEKCDRNQVPHDDVGTPKVPNPDFQPILSTSKF